MKIASLDPWRALALISFLAAGCGSDDGIASQPPRLDAAAPPDGPSDAGALAPDVATAGADALARDSGTNVEGAADAGDDGTAGGAGEPACGTLAQAPCPGALCTEGLCLSDVNKCIAPGMPCGPTAGTCNSSGTCSAGSEVCGGESQACCGTGQPSQGAYCSQSGTTCLGGGVNRTCRACGDKGQPCCGDNPGTCRAGACTGNGNNRMCP
jgi:hypothetical protein